MGKTTRICFFPGYVHTQLIETLNLYYHELMGKIEEHQGKNI